MAGTWGKRPSCSLPNARPRGARVMCRKPEPGPRTCCWLDQGPCDGLIRPPGSRAGSRVARGVGTGTSLPSTRSSCFWDSGPDDPPHRVTSGDPHPHLSALGCPAEHTLGGVSLPCPRFFLLSPSGSPWKSSVIPVEQGRVSRELDLEGLCGTCFALGTWNPACVSTGPPRESERSHYPASSLWPCGPRSSRDVDVRPRPRQTLICSFNSAEDSEESFVFAFASVPFSKKRSLALLQGNQGGAREGLHGDPQVPRGAARSHVCLEFCSGTTGFILPIVTEAAEVPPLGWGLRQAKSSSLTCDPHSRVQPLTPGPRVAGAQALGVRPHSAPEGCPSTAAQRNRSR